MTNSVKLHSQTPEEAAAVEKVEVFELDGISYEIDKKPNVGLALRYLKIARLRGEEIAAGYLLEEALGSEGYDALSECRTLTKEDFAAVTETIKKHTMGGLEAGK